MRWLSTKQWVGVSEEKCREWAVQTESGLSKNKGKKTVMCTRNYKQFHGAGTQCMRQEGEGARGKWKPEGGGPCIPCQKSWT